MFAGFFIQTPNKVYPTINKANGIVNIEFNEIELLKEIQLYNMQGQLILNKNNISSNNAEIILPDNINKGMYILKVLGNDNQIENFKIIVE